MALRIEALRTPGEGPGVRALYSKLPARSAIVAENYWLARLVNYMHFSGEVTPDPNPRVLDNDANDVRAAVADGLDVYAFEGATHWLNAQGLRFEKTDIARQPFESWIAAQPTGTLIVAASAGRALPLEWLPGASRAQGGRANYGAFAWTVGDEGDRRRSRIRAARVEAIAGAAGLDHVERRGPANYVGRRRAGRNRSRARGGGVHPARTVDRPVGVLARRKAGRSIAADAVRAARRIAMRRSSGPASAPRSARCSPMAGGGPPSKAGAGHDRARHRPAAGDVAASRRQRPRRGIRSTREGSRLILEAVPGTRSIFRLSMPPSATTPAQRSNRATLTPCACAAPRFHRCRQRGALEVDAGHDDWFGARLASRRAGRNAALPLVTAILVTDVADGEAGECENDSSNARGEHKRRDHPGVDQRRRASLLRAAVRRMDRLQVCIAGNLDAIGDQRAVAACGHDVALGRSAGGCSRARVRDAGQPRPAWPVSPASAGFSRATVLAKTCRPRSQSCRRW